MLRYPILVGALLVGTLLLAGCQLLPDIAHQPTVHNPFPQLSRVAVAPFFNLTAFRSFPGWPLRRSST
jgi:hypothetical protein